MLTTELVRRIRVLLAVLALGIGGVGLAAGQDADPAIIAPGPQQQAGEPQKSDQGPAVLTPEVEGLVRKLVEQEVKNRLDEEAKKKADKEKEEAQKKAEELKRQDQQWLEVGKSLDMKGLWTNGLQWSSADSAFRFHVGGRVDFDNVFYTQDNNIRLGSNDSVRLQDASGFRRARLRADGSFWDTVDFAVEVNFANFQDFSNTDQDIVVGAVGLTDVNLTFREVPYVGNIRVGHFVSPVGLEHVTSNSFWYYMERSPHYDAFINRFDYVSGAMAFDSLLDDRATYSAAVARTGSRTVNPFGAGGGDGEYAFILRGTALPVWDDAGGFLHLGLSLMHRVLDNKSTSPGARPLVRAGANRDDLPNVVQTGTIFGPDGSYYLNAELAAMYGPFSLSAEYLWVYMPSTFGERSDAGVYTDPRGAVSYQGFYAEAGVFLTPGDRRRYNRALGCWDRTVPVENGFAVRGEDGKPIIGRGAVQMLCRFSYLDLTGGDPVFTPTAGARAGITKDITVGLNWYLNPQTVLSANYGHTHITSVAPGLSGGFDGLGVRLHFDF